MIIFVVYVCLRLCRQEIEDSICNLIQHHNQESQKHTSASQIKPQVLCETIAIIWGFREIVTLSKMNVCPFERIQPLFWRKISRLRHPVALRKSQRRLRLVCSL